VVRELAHLIKGMAAARVVALVRRTACVNLAVLRQRAEGLEGHTARLRFALVGHVVMHQDVIFEGGG